jgi:hypothetical protein
MTLTESGVDLRVTGGKPLDGPLRAALGAYRGSFVRLTWEDEPIFAAMPPVVRFGSVRFTPRPGPSCRRRRRGRPRSCPREGGDRRGVAHRRPFRRVRDIRPAACGGPRSRGGRGRELARSARQGRAPCQRAEAGHDRGARSVPPSAAADPNWQAMTPSSSTRPARGPRRRPGPSPRHRCRASPRVLQPGDLRP